MALRLRGVRRRLRSFGLGGLDELAEFTDAEIDALAQDEPGGLIIFAENAPLTGVTPAQRHADRELFQRCAGLAPRALRP